MVKKYLNGSPESTEISSASNRGIFSDSSNHDARFIADHNKLIEHVNAVRTLGMKVVMTSGSFDLVHIGHARYLEKAKEYGDVLLVGVDSDSKVKQRKGNDRPVVPEDERVQMLTHIRSVDLVTLKYPDEPKWDLIKRVSPDTLVVTHETYSEDTLRELAQLCDKLISLEPQAETSTSAQIRRMELGWQHNIVRPIEDLLSESHVPEELRNKIGQIIHRLDQ